MKKHDHEHDRGLLHDLEVMTKMTDRRSVLRLLAGASLVPLFGCSDDSTTGATGTDAGSSSGSSGGSSTTPGTCSKIPEETAGPYPGDGSNGVNVLTQSGIVRSDIRSSVGTSTTTAAGVPLTVTLKLVNTHASCAALAGYVVYLWHC
ncbi:MAG TPA: hypothetical protein VM925_31600, partial [Labilithrix sp.]|nr:hypothetical protein [Labilithrix sp.]